MKRTRVVVDATVLIVLAKLRRLGLLKTLYGNILIGPVVKTEVVDEGRRIRAAGVELVEQAINEGWLVVVRPNRAEQALSRRLSRVTRLDDGESEAIALSHHRQLLLVVDDKEARHTAGMLGIQYLGTAGVLLQAYRKRHLTIAELEDAVHDLTRVLWLSPEVVTSILRAARQEERR
jgi:predicted nucleic acid-binding protein